MILDYSIPSNTFFSIFGLIFQFLFEILSLLFSITIDDIPVVYIFISIFLMFKLIKFATKGGANDND